MGFFNRPPCPDPDNYIWVDNKETGGHWRRKRGTVKKATLNAGFSKSSQNTKISSPAARRIIGKLLPFLKGIEHGRLTVKISSAFRKSLNKKGYIDFSYLKDFDFQPNHNLYKLLGALPVIKAGKGELTMSIDIHPTTVTQHSRLVTNYYFELIMLSGDASKDNGLETTSAISPVYIINQQSSAACKLSVSIPESQWMAMIKVSCIEGNEMAVASRHYGMRVLQTG